MAQMTLFVVWASFVGGGGGNKVDMLPSLLVLVLASAAIGVGTASWGRGVVGDVVVRK
jgi:hypothetical protein